MKLASPGGTVTLANVPFNNIPTAANEANNTGSSSSFSANLDESSASSFSNSAGNNTLTDRLDE